MTQELRRLAERLAPTNATVSRIDADRAGLAILSLLDRLEAAEKDAARWRYAVEIGGNQTMNWLDVYDDWDGDGEFTAQIDRAMEASK